MGLNMPAARYFEGSLPGMPATDGSGVQLTRMVGNPALDMLDPFLMLDLIDSDDPNSYIAGFPSHPHRGFETVTVMLEGFMRHQDSVGNDGLLRENNRFGRLGVRRKQAPVDVGPVPDVRVVRLVCRI